MLTKFLHFAFLMTALSLLSCEAADIIDPPLNGGELLNAKRFTTGDANDNWIYFSFDDDTTVAVANATISSQWDIAFLRTTLKINGGTSGPGDGGVLMLSGVNFEDITEVPTDAAFVVDDTLSTGFAIPTGSDSGWYHYTGPPNHWILAIEGRVLIFRTADGRFAKVRIVAYYSDGEQPDEPLQTDSGFYTFDYVYQPDGTTSFE